MKGLLAKVKVYCPNADVDSIERAYECSKKAFHHDNNGPSLQAGCDDDEEEEEAYLDHILGVAHIIADMKLDVASIITGILFHAVTEEKYDAAFQISIASEFGFEISKFVKDVRNIGRITLHPGQEEEEEEEDEEVEAHREAHAAENYRKMIVAMASDIRVILVKLADRLHAARTWRRVVSSSEEEQRRRKRVARETLELYAPLAHRLGMYWVKTELEDACLQCMLPEVHEEIESMVAAEKEEREEYTNHVIRILKDRLAREAGMLLAKDSLAVTGRPKSFFSIYRKMQSAGVAFHEIQDLTAFRILVDDVGQSYQALGIVHSMWKPVPNRFKDYIALPKANGYQSLHTTVIGPNGTRIEVQIRTHEMHEVAEGGVAAHWMYKGGESQGQKQEQEQEQEARRFLWLRQLVDWAQQPNDDDPQEMLMKEDLFQKEVFVFSPKGNLFVLPKNSCIIDFAYRVHSDLGNHCIGGRVNGRMVPLKHTLSNGDTVEIIQSSTQTPHREWLDIVQTTKAKGRIRSWIKKQQREHSVQLGWELLERGLKKHSCHRRKNTSDKIKQYREKIDRVLATLKLSDEQHLLASIGSGHTTVPSVIKVLFGDVSRQSTQLPHSNPNKILPPQHATHSLPGAAATTASETILVGGTRKNLLLNFCGNCNPLHGEQIQGVITRGRGIKVHRLDCKYLLESDEERRIDAAWDDDEDITTTGAKARPKRPVWLEVVVCQDGPGMLADLSGIISSLNINIEGVVLKKKSSNGGGGLVARFEVMLSGVQELENLMQKMRMNKGVISVARK